VTAGSRVAQSDTRSASGRLIDRLRDRRNRLIADPRFQSWAARFPFTRRVARRKAGALFDIAAGFVYSQVLWACVQLDLFETLRSESKTADQLASLCQVPPDAMLRLLRAAQSLDLLEQRDHDRFGLGELGAAVLGNPGIPAMVAHNQYLYRDLADPLALLRGKAESALSGFWPYARSGTGDAAPYSELMSASQSLVAGDILDAVPMDSVRHLWDIAGGDGTFAAAALSRWPSLQATVLDLEQVAGLAQQRFRQAALDNRARALAGDMFSAPLDGQPPDHSGRAMTFDAPDLVSLVRVVHDHDDPAVARLFANLHRDMKPGSRLLLAEPMADSRDAARMGHAYFGLYLFAMGSGRPRTAEELVCMLEDAGFTQCREIRTYRPLMVRVLLAQA
jgi:demethylspheroidene O-methyltransferase